MGRIFQPEPDRTHGHVGSGRVEPQFFFDRVEFFFRFWVRKISLCLAPFLLRVENFGPNPIHTSRIILGLGGLNRGHHRQLMIRYSDESQWQWWATDGSTTACGKGSGAFEQGKGDVFLLPQIGVIKKSYL